MTRRLAVGMALVASALTSAAYTGAVTTGAFFAFALVAALVPGAVAALVGQPTQYGGPITALVCAVGWAIAVNALSGETSGPVARSSLICGTGSVVAVFGARRLWSPVVLLGLIANLAGAMYYGAADEARTLAVVIGLLTLLTIAVVDAARHRRTVRRPRFGVLVASLVGLALFVLAAVSTGSLLARITNRSNAVTSALVVPEAIRPPWASPVSPSEATAAPTTVPPQPTNATDAQTSVAPTTTAATDSASTSGTKTPSAEVMKQKRREAISLVLIIVLALLLLLLVAFLARMALGAYRLRRWKHRLAALPAGESTAAAWRWMVFLLRRLGWATRTHPVIDTMAADMARLAWPEPLRVAAARVADNGTTAAFSGQPTDEEVRELTWADAETAVREARALTKRSRRLLATLMLVRT